jgi:hypothetical protein
MEYQTNLGNQDCVEKARKKLVLIATRASPEKQAEETEDNVCPMATCLIITPNLITMFEY